MRRSRPGRDRIPPRRPPDRAEPVEGGGWFENAVEELCAPYLEKIRPAEGTYETEPSRIEPGASALPEPGVN